MTGYGSAEAIINGGKIKVEIRSLNGKTADIGIKTQILPKDREIQVRQMIVNALQRGNIDFFMTYEANAEESAREINSGLVMEYYRQLRTIEARMKSEFPDASQANGTDILATILRLPDVVDTKKQEIVNDGNWPEVEKCIAEALESLKVFRAREGESLKRDICAKVDSIMHYVDEVEKFESERISSIREKILSRFAELKMETDQSRLEQEMIYYIEKLDINEEKVRLRQHCRYFLETVENDPLPGKKLGFIAQEMGREINTTGSKANNTDIQKIVVKMKDELEKIKEQSLNIL